MLLNGDKVMQRSTFSDSVGKIRGKFIVECVKTCFWKIDLSKPPLEVCFRRYKKNNKIEKKNASIGHVSQKLWSFEISHIYNYSF